MGASTWLVRIKRSSRWGFGSLTLLAVPVFAIAVFAGGSAADAGIGTDLHQLQCRIQYQDQLVLCKDSRTYREYRRCIVTARHVLLECKQNASPLFPRAADAGPSSLGSSRPVITGRS